MTQKPRTMNPFPGLRPFRSDEDYLFFGREEQTLELLKRLASHRFVAVVGTSGSGKSSLVRCGLLSELQGGKMLQAGAAWEIAVTHPGGNPLGLLAEALLDADLYDRQEENARENLLATLSRSHFGLVEAVKQAGLGEDTNFLLVVDQFEEIFRFHEAGQEQQEAANEFVSLLLEAVSQSETPIYVVLTMRSDFIGECGQFEGLAEMVNRGEFLIPRLTRDQFKRVIEGPIKVAGGQITPRLLQRLLNDLGQQADQLPCLQHALMRTWTVWSERGDSEALDLDDYQLVGRMSEALSLHADEIFASLASDRHRELCRGVFQALTVQESENRGIRRPQRLRNLGQILDVPADELRPIIDSYRQHGVTFLTPSPEVELTDRTIIDISHESLMRVWTRLRHWVEEEAQAAGIYRRLSESAALYARGKAGLYRDPELGIALTWRDEKRPNQAWADRYHVGFAGTMEFLEASRQASLAEEQAQEAARQRQLEQAQQLAEARKERLEQQQRAARRLRSMIGGLAVVAAIAGIACVAALVANNKANRLAERAQHSATEANRQRETAQKAQQTTQQALIEVASQKAQAVDAKNHAVLNLKKAEVAEKAALAAEQRSREFRYATDMQLAATLIADARANAGQVFARLANHDPAANEELRGKDDLRGFEWHYLKRLLESRATVFTDIEEAVSDCALTADGELVILDENAQLLSRNATTRAESRPPLDLKKGRSIGTKALAPDGRRVALAVAGEVHVVDAATGAEVFHLPAAATGRGLIFSHDSRMLITLDSQIVWWDAASGSPIASAESKLSDNGPLSISRDGLTLAVGGQRNKTAFSIFRMNPETREVQILQDKRDAAFGGTRMYAISPDGKTLAVTQMFDGQLRLYDTATGAALSRNVTEHSASISAIGFSPSGDEMVTASLDGAIKVWKDFRSLKSAETTLLGHTQEVTSVFFADGGKKIVSTSLDKSTRIWDLTRKFASLHQKVDGLNSVRGQFSPDGLLVATTEGAGGIRIKDAATGKTVRVIAERTDGLSPDSIAFAPDNRVLAVGFGGAKDISFVELWDLDRGERLAIMPGTTDLPRFITDERSGIVSGLAFSPDGKHLAASFGSLFSLAAGKLGNSPLAVYDVAARRVVRWLEGHKSYTTAVAFSRDGTRMASGSYDGSAIIWDTKNWSSLHVLNNPDPSTDVGMQRVFDVAFSPDGNLLAMASYEGNVIVWDVAAGKHLHTLSGHANGVSCVGFSPDGRTLASGSFDNTIRLWSVATWQELVRLAPNEGHFVPRALTFSPDGRRLLGTGGTAFLWSTQPEDERQAELTAKQLSAMLVSQADFQSRIRMLSENLRLHEALELLEQQKPGDARVQAALVAAKANWHASRQDWPQAVEAADRLKQLSPPGAEGWLRTPALLRLATAYLRQGKAAEGARLLAGGAKRRAADGLEPAAAGVGIGIAYTYADGSIRVSDLLAGYPGPRGGIRVGDVVLKVDDVELNDATMPKLSGLVSGKAGTTVKLTVRHTGIEQPEVIELAQVEYVRDLSTGELLHSLRTQINEQIAKEPRNAGLLELRAELARQWSGFEAQAADYSAAIEALSTQSKDEAAQDLARLYRRRANAYLGLEKWRQALDDYALGITEETKDEELLANQTLALAESYSPTWTVLKPAEMKSAGGAELTLEPDGSVFVGGNRQTKDVFSLDYHDVPGDFLAIRLEALRDDRLPQGGPGTHSSGNFVLSEFQVLRPDKNDSTVMAPIPLTVASATHEERPARASLERGESGWSISGGTGRNQTAVFAVESQGPQSNLNRLRILLQFDHVATDGTPAVLGRFRLSVSGDPGATKDAAKFAATKNISDPWAKLAAIHRLLGNQQAIDELVARRPQSVGAIGDVFIQGDDKDWRRAVEIYSQGITAETTDAELLSRRARAYEELKDFSAAAADWARAAEGNPTGEKLLAQFRQRLAKADQHELAATLRQQSRPRLEAALEADPENIPRAHALAQLLLEMSEPRWTIVKPQEMRSQGGATMTVLDDDSILVSGVNPDNDVYEVEAEVAAGGLTAIRLEALTHDSLPQKGHGRNPNVILTEFEAEVAATGESPSWQPVKFVRAWADHSQPGTNIASAIDGNPSTNWTTEGHSRPGGRTAIFVAESPLGFEVGTRLRIRLRHESKEFKKHTFGRFRLAVTSNRQPLPPVAPDVRARLAVAYALAGDATRAANWASLALDKAPSYDAKAAISTQIQDYQDVLAALVKLRPSDTQLQLALARNHAQRGRRALDQKRPAEALADLQQARDLFTGALDLSQPRWTVLAPMLMKSEGGATLTRLEDGSILAGGTNPERDAYTFVAKTGLPRIVGIRLEALPDPSLPLKGPGRFPGNGNFHVNEVRVFSQGVPAALKDILVAHDEVQAFRRAIDGKIDSSVGWSNYPKTGERNSALITVDIDTSVNDELKIEMYFSRGQYTQHNLGRFRLSVTGDPAALTAEQLHGDSIPGELADVQVALGKACDQTGNATGAAAALEKALSLAKTREERTKIIDQCSGMEESLAALVKTRPADVDLQLALAKSFAQRGQASLARNNQDEALPALEQARQIVTRLLAEHPQSPTGLAELELALASAAAQQGRIDEAAAGIGRAIDLATDLAAVVKTVKDASASAGLLEMLAQQRPADARFHNALARMYAVSGDSPRCQAAAAQARVLYEQQLQAEPGNSLMAGELADLLLEVTPLEWTLLKVVKAESAGGATLTVQPDGSFLASGANPDRDTYTITAATNLERIDTLRLEAMSDPSLPHGGPGRFADNGNFTLYEIRVSARGVSVPLRDVNATYSQNGGLRNIIDGQTDTTHWSIYPRSGQTNSALVFADIADAKDQELTIELTCARTEWIQHNLGRFRLSASADPRTIESERSRVEALRIAAPWPRLGAAYSYVGDRTKSAAAFARAFDSATDDAAKAEVARLAAPFGEVAAEFADHAPEPLLKLGQAKYLGPKYIAEYRLHEAVDVITQALEIAKDDIELLSWRAEAHAKLRQWPQAIDDYAAVIQRQTDPSKRREAQRARAEAQLRCGRSAEGAEAFSQEMVLFPGWDSMRDACSAQLLAANPAVAKGAASRLYGQVASADRDAYWSQWLVRATIAVPGLVTPQNRERLLSAATKAGGDWTAPMTAAIHYRLGNLKEAEPLLSTAAGRPEFLSLAALLAHDRGETDKARQFLAQAEDWFRQQRAQDPASQVPSGHDWREWGVRMGLWREAVRKLASPRIAELDAVLAKEPANAAARLERSQLLAAAGLHEEALTDLIKAGEPATKATEFLGLRGRIFAALNRTEEALADLNQAVESSSTDPLVYAARGALLLKQGNIAQARGDLEKSLGLEPTENAAGSLADLLLAEAEKDIVWTVLKPVEAKSELGATFSILADDSILAGGANPLKDRYRVVLTLPADMNVAAIRLEALTHPSLPGNGPGRSASPAGTFAQMSWGVTATPQNGQKTIKLEFDDAAADHQHSKYPIKPNGHWNIAGAQGRNCTASWSTSKPISLAAGATLSFEMQCHTNSENGENLGRFRLSVSDDPQAIRHERSRLTSLKITSGWARLAAAYRLAGKQSEFDTITQQHPEVLTSIAEAYAQVEDWQQSLVYLNQAITPESKDADLLARRAEVHGKLRQWDQAKADWQRAVMLRPEDSGLRQRWLAALAAGEQWDDIAREYSRQLDALPEGQQSWTPRGQLVRAIIRRNDPVFERLTAVRPDDAQLRIHLARNFVVRSEWQKAADEYAKVIESIPPSEEWYEYAAALLLAGKRTEHEQFRKHFFERAGATDQQYVAYALARTTGISTSPAATPEQLAAWCELSLRGERTAWYIHAAGLAQFRAGHGDEALKLLQESAATDWHPELNQLGLALLYAQRKDLPKAREYLQQAEQWFEKTKPQEGYFPVQDTDWLEAHVLMREAQSLIDRDAESSRPPAVPPKPNSE